MTQGPPTTILVPARDGTVSIDVEAAVRRGVECGVGEDTARAVADAYQRVAKQFDCAFDPSAWSNTIWEAESERYERSPSAEAHLTLLLHLHRLRDEWEAMYRRGARGWTAGHVGERLTKR